MHEGNTGEVGYGYFIPVGLLVQLANDSTGAAVVMFTPAAWWRCTLRISTKLMHPHTPSEEKAAIFVEE